MERERKVLVLLPVLNESETVSGLVSAISGLGPNYRVLVVDDGSDPPLECDFAEGVLFVRLPANFGLGVSTHVAIDHALRFGYSIMVRIDSDGQHSVSDIPRLVDKVNQSEADIVLGCRQNHRPNGFWDSRAWLKLYFSIVAKVASRGATPTDMNTGFLALNRRAMLETNKRDLERYPEAQMIFLAHRVGLRIAEVKIDQSKRTHGRSSIGMLAALRLFVRYNIIVLSELLRPK